MLAVKYINDGCELQSGFVGRGACDRVLVVLNSALNPAGDGVAHLELAVMAPIIQEHNRLLY